MKKKLYFRLAYVLLNAFLLFLIPACEDDDTDSLKTGSKTGSITGSVFPSVSISSVEALHSGGAKHTAIPDPSGGGYNFSNIAVGNYTLTFTPADGYVAPAPVPANVSEGSTTYVGPTTVKSNLGAIRGQISPFTAIKNVVATNSNGKTYNVIPESSNGQFTLFVEAGTYTLSFIPVNGYDAPAERSVTVIAEGNTNVDLVNVSKTVNTVTGTMTWVFNGVTYSATKLQCTIIGGELFIAGDAINGNNTEHVDIETNPQLPVFSGVGGYKIGNPLMAHYDRSGAMIPLYYGFPTTGYMTVTSFSSSARTIKGIFEFSATGIHGTSGTVSITNGSFDLSY
ncbi:hypothetical protein [Hymenobacter sp. BT730]|uniref:hypothetical protein n=1 Tax=Hymenobacter sp. BT730 TaxID=3063332 RepID=UPI0026E07629|nr:hypothetical protein [Hymenobacter sp. BT730]